MATRSRFFFLLFAGTSGERAVRRFRRARITHGSGFTILSRYPIDCGPPLRFAGEGDRERREFVLRRISRSRAQRGLSSAQLLPALAVVVAGRDQGGLSRTREHRRRVRPGGAQPEPGDEAAERGLAQELREAHHAAGVHPLQRLPARQVQLPVLRLARGPHLRPSIAALARRAHDLDQRGRRLLALQSQEGQHDHGRGQDVAFADAVPAERQSFAPQWSALPAELSARELARLSLLGQRAAAVSAVSSDVMAAHSASKDALLPGHDALLSPRFRTGDRTRTLEPNFTPSGEAPWYSSRTAADASRSKSSIPTGF